MKSRRTVLVSVLEGAALVAGCGVLSYVACGEDEPQAPRESRVFAADRPGAAKASDDQGAARAALDGLLGDILGRVTSGSVTEDQRGAVQDQLVRELELRGIGKAELRASAAGLVVQQIFDQSKLQAARSEMTAARALAISGMARELSRQLLAVASGRSAGADAIFAQLPAGHERLDWKRLGEFVYREGAPLPEEVLALDGHRVGVPGFMLTLGESAGVREFILVESLWGCCFGSVPDINQTIIVRLASDQQVDYTSGPLLVTGILDVGEERQGTFVTSVYRIESARVMTLDGAL